MIETCTYPGTSIGCVTRVDTDRAVFEVGAAGARVLDRFDTTLDELRSLTGLALEASYIAGEKDVPGAVRAPSR